MRLSLLMDIIIINIKPPIVLKPEELEIIDRYIKGTACDSEIKLWNPFLLREKRTSIYGIVWKKTGILFLIRIYLLRLICPIYLTGYIIRLG